MGSSNFQRIKDKGQAKKMEKILDRGRENS
jgi:hypothetical protein